MFTTRQKDNSGEKPAKIGKNFNKMNEASPEISDDENRVSESY